VAKNNQRDPNLRAATVARVNQLGKAGLSKAAAFERISAETGRAKDAVQMLYYRAIRAAKAAAKSGKPAAKPMAEAPMAQKPVAQTPVARKTRPARRAVKKAVSAPAPVAPAKVAAPVGTVAPAAPKAASRRPSRGARPRRVVHTGDFPSLLDGLTSAINNLIKHVEKTVEENATLKERAERLKAITSLIRGR